MKKFKKNKKNKKPAEHVEKKENFFSGLNMTERIFIGILAFMLAMAIIVEIIAPGTLRLEAKIM